MLLKKITSKIEFESFITFFSDDTVNALNKNNSSASIYPTINKEINRNGLAKENIN